MIRPIAVLATTVALAGCISFGATPPDRLLSLVPQAAITAGRTTVADAQAAIIIGVPQVPQSISTPRVPVTDVDGNIAYVPEAQWVEAPNRLFRDLLSETVEARAGRAVISARMLDVDAGLRLNGELRRFGIDAATNEAVVTYDAVLTRSGDAAAGNIRSHRFEARVPVTAIEAQPAGAALNQAANRVAIEVADWIGAPAATTP